MIAVVFSEAAQKAYPFAQQVRNLPESMLVISVIIGIMLVFFAGALPVFTGASVKKQILPLIAGLALISVPYCGFRAVKAATIFDAPGVVLGTVQKVEVIPGGFFASSAMNVTLSNGTGMSFKGDAQLPIGAVIIKKANAWDGQDYYTVKTDGKPSFFTAR